MKTTLILLLATLVSASSALKILVVFPSHSRSHVILGEALAKELASRNHSVTMVSPFPIGKPLKNYREILMPELFTKVKLQMGEMNFFEDKQQNGLDFMKQLFQMGELYSETAFNNTQFQGILNEKFDVVVLEIFLNEALFVLGEHFKAPVVAFGTTVPMFWTNPLIGLPALPSYVPNVFTVYTDRMTFKERLINTCLTAASTVFWEYFFIPRQDAIAKKYFPKSSSIQELRSRTNMLLVNSDKSFTYPQPLLPNLVEVGGLHIKDPKPLPKDLQDFIDSAKDGVVYFSLGSNIKSMHMPAEIRDKFLRVFAKLQQKVLWKWEDENLPGKPSNMMVSKWFPQSDILAHPNVKLFMTHGGLLSTIESINRGVPVLGIPVFADQFLNVQRAVLQGYGKSVDLHNIDENDLYQKITDLINDPKYRDNVKLRQSIFHDKETTSLNKAANAVEYTAKYKGALHLRSGSMDLNFVQYFCLDVIGVVLAVLTTALYLIYLALRKGLRLLCGSKQKPKLKSN